MVPNAIAPRQVAPTKGQAVVHALPNGPSPALARPTTNGVAPAQGLNAIAAAGAAALTPVAPSVLVQLLVPRRLHGAAPRLRQPRLLMQLAANAVPMPEQGQPGGLPVGQERPAIGPLAVPVSTVPTELRQAPVRADVPARAAVKRLLVLMGRPGPSEVPSRPKVGPALIPATKVAAAAHFKSYFGRPDRWGRGDRRFLFLKVFLLKVFLSPSFYRF